MPKRYIPHKPFTIVPKKDSKSKVIKRYDKLSKYYDSIDSIGKGERTRRLKAVEMLDVQPEDTVLDVGTGSGMVLPFIAKKLSGGRVVGVDLSKLMLEKARERSQQSGFKEKIVLQLEDIENLSFANDSFDKVIATYTFTSVPEPEAMMHECARVLRSGGRMVILDTGPPTSKMGYPLYYWMKFTAALFGYTYINRRLEDYLPPGLTVEREERFLATTVYCVSLRKSTNL